MKISIHAPTRGATAAIQTQMSAIVNFNPRSHAGSDYYSRISLSYPSYFNPRSHAGSDELHGTSNFTIEISIHAPTRGATQACRPVISRVGISIHAPTRGATFATVSPPVLFLCFNPRSHAGSDISPAWIIHILAGFQSTLPRGERR